MHFEKMFYNGRGPWMEEVATEYESADGSITSLLKRDAAKVREFYHGDASYSQVAWPGELTNFDSCETPAAFCCWPADRQANDGNGNCATPYDKNCVDKDPADNTNLCFADLEKGNKSTGFNSDLGFISFPEDNAAGEVRRNCCSAILLDDSSPNPSLNAPPCALLPTSTGTNPLPRTCLDLGRVRHILAVQGEQPLLRLDVRPHAPARLRRGDPRHAHVWLVSCHDAPLIPSP